MARMAARATPEMVWIRRCTAGHSFGTIRRMMAGGRFPTRNLTGTRAEMTLSVPACDIRRAIGIRGATA